MREQPAPAASDSAARASETSSAPTGDGGDRPADDTAGESQPAAERRSTLTRRVLRRLLPGVAVFAAVLAFVVFYVRPFERFPDSSNDALALAWNEGINRLGINPVYPPQEDLQVGDLMAAIVGSKKSDLARKSVVLAHIDMRDLILKEQHDRLLFADTVPRKDPNAILVTDRLAVASPGDDRVALELAAFPGFAIRYATHANAGAGTGWWNLTGRRDDEVAEELRIPVAETYGVSQAAALERLKAWCQRTENQALCTKNEAEAMLQFTFGHDAFAEADGVTPHVELMFVTRVYLMREIDQRRVNTSDRNVDAATSLDPATPVAAPSDTVPAAKKDAAPTSATGGATNGSPDAGATPGARLTASRTSSTEITLHQVFQRPLAFGYRYLSVLPKDAPASPPPNP